MPKEAISFFKGQTYKNFVVPVTLLSATIIGAGVFSLPYVVSQAGWIIGLTYLLISPFIFFYLHAMYADVILRSGEKFKFVGYARYYLGELAYWLSILVTVLGGILTLTAYVVLARGFLEIIVPFSFLPEHNLFFFWALGSAAFFFTVKRMANVEFIITAIMAFFIFLIFVFGMVGNPGQILKLPDINLALLFLPFGPILFSFSGRGAIPSLIDYYEENKIGWGNFKKVLKWGTTIPALAYLLFVVGVVGISQTITSNSLESISSLPWALSLFVAIAGILSLLSSYIVIGVSIKDILHVDMGWPKILTNLAVILAPILLFYIGFNNFFKVITLAGGIFLALEGIIVVAMWRRVEALRLPKKLFTYRVPEFISYTLLTVFFLGVLYIAAY